jgi:protoporphyrinogen oxidase
VVGLVVRGDELFPDHWIYVHDPEVRVGRIQNYKNWSPEMCAGDGCSNLGLEYFCDVGDATWRLSDAELAALATSELAALGLAKAEDVVDAVVFGRASYGLTGLPRPGGDHRELPRGSRTSRPWRNGFHGPTTRTTRW